MFATDFKDIVVFSAAGFALKTAVVQLLQIRSRLITGKHPDAIKPLKPVLKACTLAYGPEVVQPERCGSLLANCLEVTFLCLLCLL